VFNKKCQFTWDYIYSTLLPFFDNNLSRLDQVYLADYNGKLLYNFDPVNSRIANYFKMNQLTPLLNNELLTTATHIPTKYKYDPGSGVGKIPLRAILAKHNVASLITKEKLGFNVNTINLWKLHGYNLCKEFLDDSRVVNDGWINNDWIQKHIDNPDLDVKYVNKFLGILALEIWYRLFITKEMSSNTTLD
jgi:asparagine synthase (glutamine-hydrolysing)